ncbi:MAG: SAM-dependent methyltransferase [Rhodocyclaceae bacterium]
MAGNLYLIPVGLGPSALGASHPAEVTALAGRLDCFIVERAKTARAELKRLGHPAPIQSLQITELPERLDGRTLDELLAPAKAGRDIGLMSEAGCPAVADPGALVVRHAHALGIRVVPMVGPSSLLLGLMGSGLNGQSFAFHGYLPVAAGERSQRIKQLERESAKLQRTQLFIETPYRNDVMYDALLQSCEDGTRLCVARALTTADEWIMTRSVGAWKKSPRPDLARQPTVFLLLAQ